MRKTVDFRANECPARRVLVMLSGKHKANILHALSEGELHYLELLRKLDGISKKVLTEQIGDLIADGLVNRVEKNTNRQQVGYSLTPKAVSLRLIVDQLALWESEFPLAELNT